ncbi:MAG: cysteine desulfurase [Simkania sp.]|nr:cysteine desulfurase [Simkania sp.]
MERIYLDNNASTATAPEVIKGMHAALALGLANPSSTHSFGREARAKLIEAREEIAQFFGVRPHELIFTSGGTEALNLLIHGTVNSLNQGKIITSDIEHSAVETTLASLEKKGWVVDRLAAGLYGAVTLDQVESAIDENTRMIVLSSANNETGVKTPIEAIASLAEKRGLPFIVDGVASLGKDFISLPLGVSGVAFSSHKIHGPKGVGVAIIRSRLKIHGILTGGPQEFGKRAGTENLEGILGFACALRLLKKELPQAIDHMNSLRDEFEQAIISHCQAQINGLGPRVSNVTNLAFSHIDGETFLIHLDMAGIAASHGSACSSGSLEPSRVLLRMGVPNDLAKSSIRFTLSRFTTKEEIERAIHIVTSLFSEFCNL